MSLSNFGLDESLRAALIQGVPEGSQIARVTAVNRTNLELETEEGPLTAELTGRLRFAVGSSLELPAVGDWVAIQVLDDGSFAVVTDVLPRATELKRRQPGKRTEYQLIAANVDVAFIVQPADQPVHTRRLERYVVVARDGGVEPVILLSKTDLVPIADLPASVATAGALAETIPISSTTPGGLDSIKARLKPGLTYVLLGPSGVGKSTLLNGLIGEDVFATGDVRASDQKGRHITTRRELVVLEGGAIFIDTPGMRELGLTDVQDGLDDTFSDISELTDSCRFRDCTHTGEAGCAVCEAVEAGSLDEGRYQSYLRLQREAAHYEREYVEQRRRDRAQGKLYKEILKGKPDRR